MKYPEECDLVAVTIKHVDYYGYVDAIDKDWQCFRIRVEFFPGDSRWFDLSECRLVEYPKEFTDQ